MNVRSIAKHYSASVIKSMIFSKRFFRTGTEDRGAPSAEDDEHLNAIFTILAYIHSFSISDFLPWIRIFDLDGHGKIVRESLTIVRKYHDPEINKRILSWENGLKSKEVDFLDVLLMLKDENGKPMLTIEETEALIMVRTHFALFPPVAPSYLRVQLYIGSIHELFTSFCFIAINFDVIFSNNFFFF